MPCDSCCGTDMRLSPPVLVQVNPGLEAQAAARIYRLGQTKPTRIVRLLTENTVRCKHDLPAFFFLQRSSPLLAVCRRHANYKNITLPCLSWHSDSHPCSMPSSLSVLCQSA
jgi:hypothetical protein